MSAPPGAANLGAMNGSDVQHTLREMWETRPARPREGRQIAGVAAAIARRYDIDPVLVRVGFVVAAFYGIGAALYIAGWVLLPDEPGSGPIAGRRRPRTWLLILLGIAAVLGLGGLSHAHGGALLPVVAVAVLLFLLHRSRGGRGVAGPGAVAADPRGAEDRAAEHRAEGSAPVGATPPAWDPLGAAPFAWDLPEPTPAPAPPPRPRSRVTPVTLALALLAGGVTTPVLLAGGGLPDLPVLFGVVLAVLGGGLLVGAFLHAGRGLIPFALLAMALTWGALAAPLHRFDVGPAQDLRLAPTTPAALATRYETGLGDVTLDLRGMDLTVPPGAAAAPVATTINDGVGDVDIQVPPDADVRFSGQSGLGDVTFDGQESDGPGAELHVDDLGVDRAPSGRPLVLTVQAGVGDVAVHRG
jgi:phage shock protein PspC (stress-responsive transcriptional regulator)